MKQKKIIKTILALLLVTAFAVRGMFIHHPQIKGYTMGTSYSVTLCGFVPRGKVREIRQNIEKELVEINRQMSTWDKESEISRFNHSGSTNVFQCSKEFAAVVLRALELSRETGGAFDPTLQPLLNLWGFGSEGKNNKIPSTEELERIRKKTGWEKMRVNNSTLCKSEPEISLALGAIAKGYGVDAVATQLDEAGFKNWFVEIGGEVVAKGLNPDKVPWKIGIQFPTTNPMDTRLQGVVHLSEGAVATSGNYRNYFAEEGRVYSHILDPRSGQAVKSDTASVSVFAPNCMDADGMATALFVMGAQEGLRWVEERPTVEALFLIRGANGEIIEKFSSGFRALTGYSESP